jgi:hypothetical protein
MNKFPPRTPIYQTEDAEIQAIMALCWKHDIDINLNASIASMRASYNFKAHAQSKPTHIWTTS